MPVYGLGKYADGRPFYAMRFIRGDSLQDAIARFHGDRSDPGTNTNGNEPRNGRERSTPRELAAGEHAVEFRKLLGRFIDICQAMQYAARGVLRRDLESPGNIMLGKYGETLVVDWGLAKAMGTSDGAGEEVTLMPGSASGSMPTQMGTAMGTPAYMSPEQAEGRLDDLGPASDVYSLGATLYSVVTGQAAFRGGDPAAILERVRRGDFAKPARATERGDPPGGGSESA